MKTVLSVTPGILPPIPALLFSAMPFPFVGRSIELLFEGTAVLVLLGSALWDLRNLIVAVRKNIWSAFQEREG
jgi:hypothetical protein